MKYPTTCKVGIRESKLSQAQTNLFIEEANKHSSIKNNISFKIQTIKKNNQTAICLAKTQLTYKKSKSIYYYRSWSTSNVGSPIY